MGSGRRNHAYVHAYFITLLKLSPQAFEFFTFINSLKYNKKKRFQIDSTKI